jgi:hypothetical protein
MDLGAKVSSPACFGKEHLVLDIFIERMESAMDGGKLAEEQRACRSWLCSSMNGISLSVLNWNQSSHLDLTRTAVSSPVFLMASLNSSYDMSAESVALARRSL